MPVDLSPDDTKRFGVPSAKAYISRPEEVDAVLAFCRRNTVQLLIVRCPAEEIEIAHLLERQGMQLMDTLVFFSLGLGQWSPPELPSGVATRTLRADEIDIVARIAEEAYRGYLGHYHSDPRLDRQACDALYVDWSVRLCQPAEYPNMVLLATVDGDPAGYMAFRWRRGEDGEAVLGGVIASARRRGVYRALLASGLTWLQEQGAEAATVSSQISNVAVQKVWTRLGFEPHHSLYTFHGWF